MSESYSEITENKGSDLVEDIPSDGDPRNPFLVFCLRLIPLAKFQPSSAMSDLIPLYLSIVDGLVTTFSFCLNVFIVLFYSIVSMCFTDYVPTAAAGAYKWVSFIFAIFMLCCNPFCSFGKYFLLWGSLQVKGSKRIMLWIVFLFVSLAFDLILICFAIGAPSSVGFAQLIEIGNSMGLYFFPIVVFVFLIVQILTWMLVVSFNLIICAVVMIKIIIGIKNMVKNKV